MTARKLKKTQDQKSKISSAIQNKSGQEEMIGFALIVILVAVILLVFLGFSMRAPQKETVESYEIESFIQASLQYTTTCVEGYEPKYYSIRKLITACENNENCLDESSTCDVLKSTFKEIIEESWHIGENLPVKGYELKILSDNNEILLIQKGNITKNSKGSAQYLRGTDIFFTAYY